MKVNRITLTAIRQYAVSTGLDFDAERNGREWSVECYAPAGKVWRNHGTHFLALPSDGFYGTPDWGETLTVLTEEVTAGFDDCDEEDCDLCLPCGINQ